MNNNFIVVVVLLLTACGGGGGGGGSSGSVGDAAAPAGNPPKSDKLCNGMLVSPAANCRYTNSQVEPGARSTTPPTLSGEVNLFHRRIPSLALSMPPADVRQAWADGWTGQGVNVLVHDDFGDFGNPPADRAGNNNYWHGFLVSLTLRQIAPQVNLFGANLGVTDPITEERVNDYGDGGLRAANNISAATTTAFGVINLSVGADPLARYPTQDEINEIYEGSDFGEIKFYNYGDLTGARGGLNLEGGDDAVIAKAAGNEQVDAGFEVLNVALARHTHTGPRTLIVGALNDWGQNGGARLASYSNFAGATAEIQNRFLVEYGGAPNHINLQLCDPGASGCGNPQTLRRGSQGTSFAAPRVAGFAALLRHKFPNLNGETAAEILLNTATYRGLACQPNCAENIYGQGRVDIERALSPQGPD